MEGDAAMPYRMQLLPRLIMLRTVRSSECEYSIYSFGLPLLGLND